MTASATTYSRSGDGIPRPGMLATVRNRRGVIAAVEPYDGDAGRQHLVHVEYKDDQLPAEERLLWELEPHGLLLEPTALPEVSSADAMPPADCDALVRAARWTALRPYLDPDWTGPLDRHTFASPFHGAVQVEDYQLVPLLKALRMPRVNLLIADDVGLGKTVEAGLILTELLLRRRIQRVLVLTPASLRLQWCEELWDKFSLRFNLVDREATHRLRRQLGIDASPWRSFSRIVASYHYLRQPDVLEQFLASCRMPEGSPHLPWDLLVVDECHNLMPSPFGEDSDLCKMLRLIAPHFEHRLFLSATPHNGHTQSFTGLLEILDPVRFSQTSELAPAQRARVRQIVVRRLKREINERTSPPRFSRRLPPRGLVLAPSPREAALSEAFAAFRQAVHTTIGSGPKRKRRSGHFAVEILGKRLLSCPVAFAESWRRVQEGLGADEAAAEADVAAAERSVRQDTGDDREAERRAEAAASVVGAWLKPVARRLAGETVRIDAALEALGFTPGSAPVDVDPVSDRRFDALTDLVDELLRDGDHFRDDERLVVFTEYKTTLDYLARRLRERYGDDRVLLLFGGGSADGMGESDRERVKAAFNDPEAPVRILIATDAAAEGLNLHRTARYLLHYDCPWNPSRLEQRNGRLDRYGQARDVTIYHFLSDDDPDLRFLAHVLRKADEIREDLGSVNELFDEAAHRRLIEGEAADAVRADLDRLIAAARGRAAFEADDSIAVGRGATSASGAVEALAAEIDLDPESLRDTLEAALAIRAGRPQLDCSAETQTCRLRNPDLPGWAEVIDESLRLPAPGGARGPLARLAFGPEPLLEHIGERILFAPRPEVRLLHLAHPMFQRALSLLTRRRFPGTGEEVSRWTARRGAVPADADALVLLTLEELGVNELRESFHHWVRTLALPVRDGTLGEPLPHVPARALRVAPQPPALDSSSIEMARRTLEDVEPDLRRLLGEYAERLTGELSSQLEADGREARRTEDERYRSRRAEVSTLIENTTVARLEREIQQLEAERAQGLLFDEAGRLAEIERSIEAKEEEVRRRREHYEEVRAQLDAERERILERLLPARHTLAGRAQVFPVALEVRLPGGAA